MERLRYDVYVEEMGRPQPHADHVGRRVPDELDLPGFVFALGHGGDVVGTLRLNRLSDGVEKYRQLYGLGGGGAPGRRDQAIVTALMVRPAFRGAGAVGVLFRALYALGRLHGIRQAWIDCNPPLIPLFRAWGLQDERDVVHPLFGTVRLMRMDLLDRQHLASVRSPYVALFDNPFPHLPRNTDMTTMDRLRADFDVVADHFHRNSACDRLRRGDFTSAEYASLMAAIALQARENPQIQAYATAFFRGHQRDVVKSFFKHAVSEIGHDQLAANDAAAMGLDVSTLFAQQPLPSTVALVAYAYFTIDHHDPVGSLGSLFFLEFLPTTFGAEYGAMLDRIGVPVAARTFLVDHATVDVGHNKLMERYVEELVVDEASYAAVRYAMEVTGALYARMVEEAFDRAHEVASGRPFAPWEQVPRPAARDVVSAVA